MTNKETRALLALMRDDPEHQHSTIGETGQCPTCRSRHVSVLDNAPHYFLLMFLGGAADSHDGACECGAQVGGEVDAIAVVRCWKPDLGEACENAWATGVNTGGAVAGREIDPRVLALAGVPIFTLIRQPAAVAALDALDAGDDDLLDALVSHDDDDQERELDADERARLTRSVWHWAGHPPTALDCIRAIDERLPTVCEHERRRVVSVCVELGWLTPEGGRRLLRAAGREGRSHR
jgi:hypothetical protein